MAIKCKHVIRLCDYATGTWSVTNPEGYAMDEYIVASLDELDGTLIIEVENRYDV